ncbi:hypothetical protein BJY04DRAFT_220063 [Aspergillus karnatakaensis]|uniref:uncharacterized protein n=1 Tax=Aspergillus karnatakaensis TaxID=1810916 RepID=UPI003CCE1CB4
MDSDLSSEWSSDLPLPPEKYGPDTRPQEGHDLAIPFLYTPLPDELPTGVHKDLLLLYAAYVGNIDRYVRLRDPNHFIRYEFDCVIRGIYHDTMFAKWWSLQPDHPDCGGYLLDAPGNMSHIRQAIHARYIMNNDLSHIENEPDEDCLPYLIWYPHIADRSTYEELARRRPAMKAQAARACMVANYRESYDRINPTPDWFLVDQAEKLADTRPYYLEDLQRRAEQMGIDVTEYPDMDDRWKIIEDRFLINWRPIILPAQATPEQMADDSECFRNYHGYGVDLTMLELYVCSSDEVKRQSNGDALVLTSLYQQASRTRGSA